MKDFDSEFLEILSRVKNLVRIPPPPTYRELGKLADNLEEILTILIAR